MVRPGSHAQFKEKHNNIQIEKTGLCIQKVAMKT